jgi:sterol desaturase/sphingolipid hydroxylase (fatty acid hydroxylase superfamily)
MDRTQFTEWDRLFGSAVASEARHRFATGLDLALQCILAA